ncbi:MAG: ATP-grasp domain-containing protein [Planctomycetota bacterium]
MNETDAEPLIVVSASARAAAWSATRAGFAVVAVDQFGDEDLQEVSSTVHVLDDWPRGVAEVLDRLPDAPCIYGGGLENHPAVIEELAASRELAGCAVDSLRLVRDPFWMAARWSESGLAVPRCLASDAVFDRDVQWLLKPLRSAGGIDVCVADAPPSDGEVLQEFIKGEIESGLYLGNGENVRLLGMSSQLVGCEEAGASGFVYCGSIWSAEDSAGAVTAGEVVVREAGLTGLFGVDFVRDAHGALWPIEVNPRYPASAEQCERSTGWPLMRWHVEACRSGELPSAEQLLDHSVGSGRTEGKVVVYSPCDMTAPDLRETATRTLPREVQLADIPAVGSPLQNKSPVCSLLMSADESVECRDGLLKYAAKLRSEL